MPLKGEYVTKRGKIFKKPIDKAPKSDYNVIRGQISTKGSDDMRVKLVELRKARGYTQSGASAVLGISRSHYSQIETGEKSPSLKLAVKIKEVFGYKKDDIFFDAKSPVSGLSAEIEAAKRNV